MLTILQKTIDYNNQLNDSSFFNAEKCFYYWKYDYMKQHLAKLLLEEYKQQCLFDELEKKGVSLTGIWINNLDVVLDIVGFPKDNTIDYYRDKNGRLQTQPAKIIDENCFCRDWLTDKYFEVFNTLKFEQKVYVTDKGLEIESGADKEKAEKIFTEYVEWLYIEFEEWKRDES